jgi:hypothetical protein
LRAEIKIIRGLTVVNLLCLGNLEMFKLRCAAISYSAHPFPMSTQRVPLSTVQKLRQYIKQSLVLPESENHPRAWSALEEVDDLPNPDSLADLGDLFNFGETLTDEDVPMPNVRGNWFISATNPGTVFHKLPGLRLKPGLRWAAYLYRLGDDGQGKVWALPEHLSVTAHLQKALTQSGDGSQPPQPDGSLEDFMDAVAGDRTPLSFLIASLLRRELLELGALGRSCDWGQHQLIDNVPPQAQWKWRSEGVKDLSAKVRLFPDGKAVVEFFTCRVNSPVAICQHLDQYAAGQYKALCFDRTIAIGYKAAS